MTLLTEILTGTHAFLVPEDCEVLAKYAAQVSPPACIVGIGAGYGASGSLLLLNSRVPVYEVDVFIRDPHTHWIASADQCMRGIATACHAFGTPEAIDRYALIESTSLDAARGWSRKALSIGFLFIDADHSYEAVKADYDAWSPWVVPGGWIALHDSRRLSGSREDKFNRGWQGPTQLAKELRKSDRVKLVDAMGSTTVWEMMP